MITDYTTRLPEADRQTVLAAREIAARYVAQGPLLTSWDALQDYLTLTYVGAQVETLRTLFLDRKNRLIEDVQMTTGTVTHVPVYPREIIHRALTLGASALILVHNHPSGDPEPSASDIGLTKEVRKAANVMDITLHDHVIVGGGKTASMRALGLI